MLIPLRTLALVLAAGAPVLASDLKLDGQSALTKPVGTSLEIEVTGGNLLPVFLAVDVSAGPTTLVGESLPLGFTPNLLMLPGGSTKKSTFTTSVDIPNDPALVGGQLFFLGLILDPADPNGLDFTPGAQVTLAPAVDKVSMELAGNAIAARPNFEFVKAINLGSTVSVSVDPQLVPSVAGQTAELFVVDARTSAEWDQSVGLIDVSSGGAETVTFSTSGVVANTFVVDNGSLASGAGETIGRAYDVVVDLDRDGNLSSGDLIDGYGDEAGFYVVRDLTLPGPYAVTEGIYSGGTWLGQDTYYPSNIATMGKLPIVVISHGNGHNYQWYDHIGNHLASWGFVVMSHQNNTGPGIQTASLTTLDNTDYFIRHQDTILGGALSGHLDNRRIAWVGHSRGAEGVARAYDRLFDGTYTPLSFKITDIKLISSIAPTDFLGTAASNPHDANFHLWVGQSDSDVNGCASNDIAQSFHILERAEGVRQSTSLQGVGHAWFHDAGGNPWAAGPCQIGEAKTHQIQLGYLLPLVAHYVRDNVPSKDFLTRQYESFHPIGAPVADPCVVVNLQYKEPATAPKRVIDDFQTNGSTALASSGAAVTFTVQDMSEGRLNDINSVFTDNFNDPFNGFTSARLSDNTLGSVFSANGLGDFEIDYNITAQDADWSSFKTLSFRGAQATRHPFTVAVLGDFVFDVELVDGAGRTSSLSIGAYGGGLEEPYQRTGCGTGAGWGNEFETIRLPLNGFRAEDPLFDLTSIDHLIFRFGPSHGSGQGRIGLDDIELLVD